MPVTEKPKDLNYFGAGGIEKRPFVVPNPGVSVNGKLLLGRCELTADERDGVMAMISQRTMHELKARLGEKEAQKIYELTGATNPRDLF